MKTTLANIPSMYPTTPRIINPVERLVFTCRTFDIVSSLAKIPPPHSIDPSRPKAKIGL